MAVNDPVIDGREGAEHRRIRAERVKAQPCQKCGGLTIMLRDGLCKFCHDDKVYHS